MIPKQLPVYEQRETILKAVSNNQVIIVESPTGSGKTTQLPIILYESEFLEASMVGVTQPRRIAAVSVSEFIARQLGDKVPGIAGYKIRFEDRTHHTTKIKIMTDGILLQELKADPWLLNYSLIIVDEAHERSLNIDFILGLLKTIVKTRKDFKIIISSATMKADTFAYYFNDAPIISIESQMYPVQVIYDKPDPKKGEEGMYERIVDILYRKSIPGDVLIFLGGEKSIKDCIRTIEQTSLRRSLHILPLYGKLSKEEQDRVFLPAPKGKTKVVVATNIAETSLTIDGITIVVDSGLAKLNYYNHRTFTSSLIEGPISKASCNQRKGRAGRTQPGTCYRLYTKKEYDYFAEYTLEEIHRTDLSEVVLRMAELKIKDFEQFDFISSPSKQGILGAIDTLELLQALDAERTLTTFGKMMVEFPLLPRHSRMIVEAIHTYPDVLEETLIAAAFLSTHSPFLLPQGEEIEARNAHHRFSDPAGDFVSYLHLFKAFKKQSNFNSRESFCTRHYLDLRTMMELVNIKEQLEEIVTGMRIPITSGGSTKNYLCAVATGLIQFVCIRTGRGSYRTLTAERIQIHPGSVMFRESPPFIVAGEIVKTSRMFARSVSPINRQWIMDISHDLFDAFISDKSKKKTKKEHITKEKDTTWQLKLGNYNFEIIKHKGKKKLAVLPWHTIIKVVNETSPEELAIHNNMRAKLVYEELEIHTGDQLGSIIKIIPYINPEQDLQTEIKSKGTFNTVDHVPQLCNELSHVLKIGKIKKKSNILGFRALHTDGVGNYWFRINKNFHSAVDVTLGSLEILADELDDRVDKEYREKVNSVYRKVNTLFES